MLPGTEHLLSGLPLMRYDCSAELGTEFAVRVEAKHVIDTDAQVYENVCSHMKHLRLFLKVIFHVITGLCYRCLEIRQCRSEVYISVSR